MNVNSITDVNAQLLAALNGTSTQQTTADGSDFSTLIAQLLGTDGTANAGTSAADLMSALLGTANSDDTDTDNQLAQLLAQYNASQTYLGQNGLADVLLGSLDTSSGDTANSALLSMAGQTSGNSDVSSSIMSQMLSAFNTKSGNDDNGAISLMSAFPINALEELAKINAENSSSATTETDFSNLSTDEKLQVLKDAIANGEVTIDKDTNLTQVISDLGAGYKLSQNVAQAKKTLESTDETPLAQTLSDPTLTGSDKVYSFDEITANSTDSLDESQSVYLQTLQSVETAVSEGTQKFTVKLNPEGLGEIVVNLEKSGDAMVLNLVASSARTAELLNSQLSNLQASLSQYNAQVNTAVVTPSNESAAYNFNQQMAGQQFSQNGGYQQQNAQHNTYTSAYTGNEDAVTQAAKSLAYSGALNTYA